MFRSTKQLVVTAHQPWRKWVVLAVLAVAVPLGAWGLYSYGLYRAGFDSLSALREQHELRSHISVLEKSNGDLSQQVANLEREKQVDQRAYADIKASLESMQDEISELKEEVAFYRGIAAPQDAAQGVRIQGLQLSGNGSERGYSYKLVLVQMTKGRRVTRGTIKLTAQGVLNKVQKEYSFGELAGKNAIGKFHFKYFGEMEGDIILPADFNPTRVVVHVKVESPKHSEVEKVYAWQDILS
ncbi:MAG: hypothetical protein P8141_08555 [Gammaproteobacteria bacterium]